MNKFKRFVIGDIHGQIKALKQVLKLSKFDYKNDKLIILGDVVDGGFNSYEVVKELLKIKHRVFILGNHDQWFIWNLEREWKERTWTSQGGNATLESYRNRRDKDHKDFFMNHKLFHIEDGMAFVHGGFFPGIVDLNDEKTDTLLWDRQLISWCYEGNTVPNFKKVFVGHTTTQHYDETRPLRFNNLIMMDCGAGWNGRLSIMDIDTEEYWLSDIQVPPDF